MGHAREKYTRAYFLRRDEEGQPTTYGVMGVAEFERGGIRAQDRDILAPLNFAGKAVLEIGFGRGEALKFALEHGARRAVGVDFAPEAVAIAEEFLRKHNLEAELFCADALEFLARPQHSTGFDIVLMLDVIEHIPRGELSKLLRQMHGVLKAKALLAINTPVFGADNDVLTEGLKARARDESDDYPETCGMHCNRYTRRSLRSFLRACGYTAIGGHYFAANFRRGTAVSDRSAWQRAFRQGYPLATPEKPTERFDFAYSSRQQAQLRRLSGQGFLGRLGKRVMPLVWRLRLMG